MPWKSFVDKEANFITIEYIDIVPKTELFEALYSAVDLAFKNGIYLFLADCRELKGGHSVIDLYDLVMKIDDLRKKQPFKEAVLFQENKWLFKEVLFFETVCFNKGYLVKAFNDRSKAVNWLLNKG